MGYTQIRGNTQIIDGSLTREKLVADFLGSANWDLSGGKGDATITGLANPTTSTDAATKDYVDTLVDATLKTPEAYDPTTTGNYPITYGGESIQAGDSFRIIATQANVGDGTRSVNTEDLLIALIDNPSATDAADWIVAESNRTQATETTLGLAKLASQAVTDAGINDTDIVTPLKLATYVDAEIQANILTYENGLNYTQTTASVGLGGTLSENTEIEEDVYSLKLKTGNVGVGFGTGTDDNVTEIHKQSDGKIIVGGHFGSYSGTTVGNIVRLNSDGTEDTVFTTNVGTGYSSDINSIAIQNDDKILLGGWGTAFNGTTVGYFTRLNADGTLDTAFNTNLGTGFDSGPINIQVQTDGKILVAGYMEFIGATAITGLVRLNSDGTLDTTFNTNLGTGFDSNPQGIAVQPDGKIIIVGYFNTINGTTANYITRLNSDGTLDTAFNTNTGTGLDNNARWARIQSDGKIVIGGHFTTFNGTSTNYICRLNSDGTLDTTFTTNVGTTFDGAVSFILIDSDEKILVGTAWNADCADLIRLNTDGTVDGTFPMTDTSFGLTSGNKIVRAVYQHEDGSYLVGGAFDSFKGKTGLGNLVHVSSTATVQEQRSTTFSGGIIEYTNPYVSEFTDNTLVHKAYVDSQTVVQNGLSEGTNNEIELGGKLIQDTTVDAAGSTLTIQSIADFDIGSGFNNTVLAVEGYRSYPWSSPNSYFIGGEFTTYNGQTANRIIRIDNDGAVDIDYGTGFNNRVRALKVQFNNGTSNAVRLYAVGDFATYDGNSAPGIAKLALNDATFYNDFVLSSLTGQIYTVDFQTSNKAIIGGTFTNVNGTAINRIARLNTDATLDATFVVGGGFLGGSQYVEHIEVASDDTVFVGGSFVTYNGTTVNNFVKLDANGGIAAGFTTGTGFNGTVRVIKIQSSDSKILVGGDFTEYNGTTVNRMVRLNTDGTLDNSFNPIAANSSVYDIMELTHNDTIVIVGNMSANIKVVNKSNGSTTTAFDTTSYGFNSRPVSVDYDNNTDSFIAGGYFSTYKGDSTNRIARINEVGGTLVNNTTTEVNFKGVAEYTIDYSSKYTDRSLVDKYYVDNYLQPTNGLTKTNEVVKIGGDLIENTTIYSSTNEYALRTNLEAAFDRTTLQNHRYVHTIVRQTDGKYLLGGYQMRSDIFYFGRVNNDGTEDTTFDTNINRQVYSIVLQPDGKILVGGEFTTGFGADGNYFTRLNTDGSTDTAFNTNVLSTFTGTVERILLQSDGKIVVATNASIIRLNSDGTTDGTFIEHTLPAFYDMAHQSDEKIIVTFNGTIRRLNTDGTTDGSFSPTFTGTYGRLIIQPDDKIIRFGTSLNGSLVRLNSDGTNDESWNIPTFSIGGQAACGGLQSDGKIVIGGDFTTVNGVFSEFLARLNSDGTFDDTYANFGNIWTGSGSSKDVRYVFVDPDDKVLINPYQTGNMNTPSGEVNVGGLTRLTSYGTIDGIKVATFRDGLMQYDYSYHPDYTETTMVDKRYADRHIFGKTTNTLRWLNDSTGPGLAEDGYALKWDNQIGEFVLGAAASDSSVNDVKNAELLNLDYNDPTRQVQTISGTYATVETFNPDWSKYNSTSFGTMHSLIYVNGYLYGSTRQMPARIMKMNANDLSDYEVITFTGTNSTSQQSVADRLIYSEYKNKIYVPFGDPDFNRDLEIAEVDPDDLSYTITSMSAPDLPGFPTGVAKGNKLYVLTGSSAKLYEFNLDTYNRERTLSLPANGTYHAINIDGDHIYVTGIYAGARVHKVSISGWSVIDSVTLPTEHMTDEFCIAGDYLWIGHESSFDSGVDKGIYVVNKNNLSDYHRIFVDNSSDSNYGTFYDEEYVWTVFGSDPAEIMRIDPHTFEVRKMTIDVAMPNTNSIAFDGKNLFLSTFNNPAVVGRFTVPNLFEAEAYYAGTDNDVLFRISNTNKRLELTDSIIYGNLDFTDSNVRITRSTDDLTLAATGAITMTSAGSTFTDSRTAGSQAGIEYAADYSADYTLRSLVDKNYVDNLLTFENGLTETSGTVKLGGTITEPTTLDTGTNLFTISGANLASPLNEYAVTFDDSGLTLNAAPDKQNNGAELDITMDNGGMDIEVNDANDAADQQIRIQYNNSGGLKNRIELSSNGILVTENGNAGGIRYSADYSSDFTSRSLVDKAYVDGLVDPVLKSPDSFDAAASTGGAFPTVYKATGVVSEGDTFYITSPAILGSSTTVNTGDLLVANVDNPGQTDANWYVLESNRDQATESILGVAAVATQAETDAGSNDTDFVTPLKLATALANANVTEVTASNGLTKTVNNITLGGVLSSHTTIDGSNGTYDIKLGEKISSKQLRNFTADVDGSIGLRSYSSSGGSIDIVIDSIASINLNPTNGITISDFDNNGGAKYASDYSTDYTTRSLVDKGYVDTADVTTLSSAQTYADTHINGKTTTTLDALNTNTGPGATEDGYGLVWDNTSGEYILAATETPLTFENGLTEAADTVKLGGTLTADTNIAKAGFSFTTNGTGNNTLRTEHSTTGYSIIESRNGAAELFTNNGTASSRIQVTAAAGMTITDGINSKGIEYVADYSANWTDRSLIDKAYADSLVLSSSPLTRYTNEIKTVTNGSPTLNALNNLGSHATIKVDNVEVYLNGILQTPGITNDYTIDQTTGIITFTSNLVTEDVAVVNYDSRDADGSGSASIATIINGLSGVNADTVDNYHASITSTANTCAVRDGSQDITAHDFIITSDLRLKENINILDKGIDGLLPKSFQFKGEEQIRYGFVAQDVLKSHPELVREKEGFYSISEGSIIPLLVNEINSLKEEIKTLKG